MAGPACAEWLMNRNKSLETLSSTLKVALPTNDQTTAEKAPETVAKMLEEKRQNGIRMKSMQEWLGTCENITFPSENASIKLEGSCF